MTSVTKSVMTGGCQCGEVRYALMSEPTRASICHCRMCQKAFGNYFASLTGVPRRFGLDERAAWHLQEFAGGGARLLPRLRDAVDLFLSGGDRIRVSIGSLDEPGRVTPEIQYGLESKLPAFEMLHTLPGQRTDDYATPADREKMASRQHPDHE